MLNPIHLAGGLLFLPATWVDTDPGQAGRARGPYGDLRHYSPSSCAPAPALPEPGITARVASWVRASWRAVTSRRAGASARSPRRGMV